MTGKRSQQAIKRLPNGRYRLWIDVAPKGQPRQQRTFTFNTKKEATAKAAAVKAARDRGEAIYTRARTFKDYADAFIAAKAEVLRPETVAGYASALKHPIAAFGDRPINDIGYSDVEAMLMGMIDRRTGKARPLAKRTREDVLGRTAQVFDRAMKDRVISHNPARLIAGSDVPGRPAVERTPIAPQEMTLISQAVNVSPWKALWMFTLLGLRRSEVLALTWETVDLERGVVRVEGSRTAYGKRGDAKIEAPKTKRSRRTIPLLPDHVSVLREWKMLTGSQRFVAVDDLLRPIGPDEYSRAWAALVASAGIDRPVLLHEARHAAVTWLRERGLPERDIAAFMGHDPAMTVKVYDHHRGDFDDVLDALADHVAGAARPDGCTGMPFPEAAV